MVTNTLAWAMAVSPENPLGNLVGEGTIWFVVAFRAAAFAQEPSELNARQSVQLQQGDTGTGVAGVRGSRFASCQYGNQGGRVTLAPSHPPPPRTNHQ